MELISEIKKQKIYQEGNKTYYMTDMGDYVGFRNRQWYENVPEFWQLTKSTEICKDGETCEISSLISDKENYLSIHINKGDTSRVLCLTGPNMVYSDYILNKEGDFYALYEDIFSKNKVELDKYLLTEPTFTNEKGDRTTKNTLDNSFIKDFLNADKELKATINNTKKR